MHHYIGFQTNILLVSSRRVLSQMHCTISPSLIFTSKTLPYCEMQLVVDQLCLSLKWLVAQQEIA